LRFNDFKGKPAKSGTLLATSVLQFQFKFHFFDDIFWYELRTSFLKKESWASIGDSSLMVHEQLHFDLMEVYSRILKKQFQEFTNMQVNDSIVRKTYKVIENQCKADQELFDEQTGHGINSLATKEWTYKIRKMLDSLDAYKEPTGMVSIVRE
jgi:hypothetical protein